MPSMFSTLLKEYKDQFPAASVEKLESQIKVTWLKFSAFLLSLFIQIVSGFAELCAFELSKITR